MDPVQLLLITFGVFPVVAWIIYTAALRGRLHWFWVFGLTCIVAAGIFWAAGQAAVSFLSQERERYAQAIGEEPKFSSLNAERMQNAERSRARLVDLLRVATAPWAIGWTALIFIICALIDAAIRGILSRTSRVPPLTESIG